VGGAAGNIIDGGTGNQGKKDLRKGGGVGSFIACFKGAKMEKGKGMAPITGAQQW